MLLRRLLGSCLDQDFEEQTALSGEERRQCGPPPLSRRTPPHLAQRPPPPQPQPPLSPLPPHGCAAPPSPSKLPVAAGSLSPCAIRAPSSLEDALLWLDGSPAGAAASPAATSAPTSPAAWPLMPAEEQVRRAFAAGQHRRRVSPAQQDRERRRLREEQADHRRTIEALERGLGHSLATARPPRSRSPEQRQAGQGQRSGDGCPGAQRHSGQRAAQQEKAPGGHAGPPPAALGGFSLAPVFETSGGGAPQLAPLHSQQRQMELPSAATAVTGARPGPLTVPFISSCNPAAAAGGAGAGGPSSDAGTAGRAGGSTCSVQAQPAGSCGGGSTARPESPAIEIEVDEVEFVWAATPAGAGNTLAGVGGSWQAPATQRQGRSPADREEVPLGAARTPSFEAIIQGAQQCDRAGAEEGSSGSGCSTTAASRPMPRRAPAAGGAVSIASTPQVASAEGGAAAPSLPACSSTDALLAAEEAGASSTSAGGLILAARCGPPGAGSQGRRLSPRPLLAQLAQALHGLPQRAAAAASSGKQRRQKEPAAEDVRPRLHAPPAAVQAATLRRGRLAAGHSADENSPL